MAADLEKAKRSRAAVIGLLTKQRNIFDDRHEAMTLAALKVMAGVVDDYYARYNSCAEKVIELATEQEEIDTARAKDEEFAESYIDLKSEIMELIDKKTPKKVSGDDTLNNSLVQNAFRLKKLDIPKFSGKYTDWSDFKSSFTSSVLNNTSLDGVTKFEYLKSSLSDKPRRIVSNMEVTEDNFEKAWDDLCQRYDDKYLIFRTHINEILSLQGASGSPESVRTLLDEAKGHYRALGSLGSVKEIADNFIIALVLQKLSNKINDEWEDETTENIATWEDFVKWLEKQARHKTTERPQKSPDKPHSSSKDVKMSNSGKNFNTVLVTNTNHVICPKCKKAHDVLNCPEFLSLAPDARYNEARALRLCVACLIRDHSTRFCKKRCAKCSRRHHELLHFPEVPVPSTSAPHTALMASEFFQKTQVLLASVTIMVRDSTDNLIPCNAVLDSGSTDHYISENFARLINAPRTRVHTVSGGIGDCVVYSKGKCTLKFTSRFDTSKDYEINPTILKRITDSFPPNSFDVENWNIPAHIPLADPNFNISKHVDLLIGGGLFWQLLTMEKMELGPDLPMLFGTDIGYIVVGPYIPPSPSRKTSLLSRVDATNENVEELTSLDELVKKFWDVDSFSEDFSIPMNPSDQFCEDQYVLTTRRDKTGRYFVKLPFKSDPSKLGNSKDIATRRFYNLERKLTSNPDVKEQYSAFINEYKNLGHLEVLDDFDEKQPHYFLPHHCVLKPTSSSTKLRVVFDASCKTSSGLSLNDILHPGPKIQNDLMITLLRFRLHPYVATGDIQKMYRQIYINPPDSNFQLILWRESNQDPLQILRLNTVTYGTAPGAFLSIRTLHKLAEDEGHDFPIGAKLLRECFYVDDAMIGAESIEALEDGLNQLRELLGRGCFRLSKFCSNSQDILKNIPPESQEKLLNIDNHDIIKALGLMWQPDQDVFRFTCQLSNDRPKVTRRGVLSEIAKIFDPLGFMCPVVSRAKMFLQLLWQIRPKLDWDTPLPSDLSTAWSEFKEDLIAIKEVSIPRFVFEKSTHKNLQIHGFADASEKAYGCCVYVRATHLDGTRSVHLLTSKSRVAPTKTLTIARLELCAATMLCELIKRLMSEVFNETNIDDVFYWTDSSIVLSWLNAPASSWTTFVAHRIAKIQDLSTSFQWCHVPSEMNPADLVSRGMNTSELISCDLWWKGPQFLHKKEIVFPSQFVVPSSPEDVEEFRPLKRALFTRRITDLTQNLNFSTGFRGTCRVFSYVLRFIERCKKPVLTKAQRKRSLNDIPALIKDSIPTLKEELLGERALIKIVQRSYFHVEYNCLLENKQLPRDSPLKTLNPFVDIISGLMRVGGRLKKAKIPFDARHQILLPKDHKFTQLLFLYYHEKRLFHAGPQTVLMAIRNRYWPIGGLKLSRSVVQKCVWCSHVHPKMLTQLMGDLPRDRVNPQDVKPFCVTGVDYAGPIRVKHHIRCKQQKEVHVALFVCFVTKAIHVEVVPDRSTEAFIRALKRFVADRGTVTKIYSDNATNFKGAANYLKELRDSMRQDEQQIRGECQKLFIDWSFIPPRTPHQGGLWESSIKLLKNVLKNIVSDSELTEDELYTAVKQAASIVNSRPLSPMSSDPNDLQPLTPGTFLFGAPPTTIFEPTIDLDHVNKIKLIHKLKYISQEIWRRFYKEYLATLQTRNKWYVKSDNVKIGDLVVVKKDNVEPMHWPMGRILEVQADDEGNVRAVKIKTSEGEYARGITQIALLPVNDNF